MARFLCFITTSSIILLFCLAQATEQQHESSCNNKSRTTPPLDTNDDDDVYKCNTSIIQMNTNDESITLHTQTYHHPSSASSSSQYGYYKVMRHVNKIQRNAPLLHKLTAEVQQQQQDDDDEQQQELLLFNSIIEGVINEMLALALLHRDEWSETVLQIKDYEGSSTFAEMDDHFKKAVNAYESTLIVYKCLWNYIIVLQKESSSSSYYQNVQETISIGISSVHLLLGDMYHQRHLLVTSTVVNTNSDNVDDCFMAYKHLVQSEYWCDESLSILLKDINLANNKDEGGLPNEDYYDAEEEEHYVTVTKKQVRESMAFIKVRMGTLLLDLYRQGGGYTLDENDRLVRLDNFHNDDDDDAFSSLGEDDDIAGSAKNKGQQRILQLSLTKLLKGSTLYNQLAEEEEEDPNNLADYRLSIADASNYLGEVYSNLHQWTHASTELEKSISLYNSLFNDYETFGMVNEAIDIASSMIQTTQSLWETYLTIPQRASEATDVFYTHLVMRRYYEKQVSLNEPLIDDEEEYEEEEDINNIVYSIGGASAELYELYDESLSAYQTALDEYLKLISELPPDGSYFEMGFDAYDGNTASVVQHDQVYEGSLRSAIGSIHLAKNRIGLAKVELELAVRLIREGMSSDYAREYEDVNGEKIDYSVELELANALLNLAYVLLGHRQWKSSFDAFSESMDLYASELKDGESPMNHSGMEEYSTNNKQEQKGTVTSLGERLTKFIKTSLGTDDDVSQSIINEDGSQEDASQFINLDNYQVMGNITSAPEL